LDELHDMSSLGDRPDVPLSALRAGGVARRDFLKLVGAGAALLGSGCAQRPSQSILAYGETPPEVTPGNPERYATSFVLDGLATRLLVTSNDGRPTKVEGNPDHPASLGAAGVFEQASVLSLYDTDRPATVSEAGTTRSMTAFETWLGEAMPARGENAW